VRTSSSATVFSRLAIILVACTAFASRTRADVSAENDVRSATLRNGLRVVVVRDPLAPVVAVEVNYLVGSNETPPGFPGTAHAQEHMMFRGSPGLSADQLAAVAAAMGGQFNADTRQTVTQYFFTVPAEDLGVALRVEALRMSGVLDSEEHWSKERAAIEQEVAQDLSDPQYVFYTKLLAALFGGTPYEHDALGTRESFDKTTGSMLKAFYDTWYSPNNAILIVAGDVRPRETMAQVERAFGEIPSKPLPPRPEVHLAPVQAKTLRLDTDLPYGLVAVAFRMPGTESPDYAATLILSEVLNSQRGALYDLVPEGKALYAGFSSNSLPAAGVGAAIAAFPRGGDAERLLKEVAEVLATDRRRGFPEELVEAAKRRERADFEFRRDSVAGLAELWSEALAVEGRESPADDVKAIEKVSVADVNRVARLYLDPGRAVSAVLTPQSSGSPITARGFGGTESPGPKNAKAAELPQWAEEALGQLRIPASTVHPVVSKLPNGLTLIVQPETVSKTVSVFGSVRHEPALETPPGQDGVDDVLEQLFSFGTRSLDRLAFQKALDDIGAEESAGAEFSLRVLPAHLERGLELLADNLLHPALPQSAFDTVRQQTALAAAGTLTSPDHLARRALDAALFPLKDPTLRETTPATVSSLTYADLRAYYRRVFRPDLTAIVVVGDVSAQRVEAAVRNAFGKWEAVGPQPRTFLPKVPLNGPSTAAVPDASRTQDDVTLGETLGLTRSHPDYYALALGNYVLSGGFYASRLDRDLREEGGLVYSVRSTFDAGQTRSVYTLRFGCDPRDVSRARAVALRDLEAMRLEPPTDLELRSAKALALREIPLSESSVPSIGLGLLYRAQHDLPLDEPSVAARAYFAMKADRIRAAFASWMRPNDLVQVTEGPEPR